MNVVTPQQRARRAKELRLERPRQTVQRNYSTYRGGRAYKRKADKRVWDHVIVVGATIIIVMLAALAG